MNEKLPSHLREAVEKVYSRFRQYPLDPAMEGDPAFPSFTDNSVFQSKSLRELNSEDFRWYSFKGMTTWGTIKDFKHFLPRLLELMALDAFIGQSVDQFSVFSKLKYSDWSQWPKAERLELESFLKVMMESLLQDASSTHYDPRAFELLGNLAETVHDINPWLEIIEQSDSPGIDLQLAYFFLSEKDSLLQSGTISTSYIDISELQSKRQIISWLKRASVKARFEKAFFAHQGTEQEQVFSEADFWHEQWTQWKTDE